MPKEIKKTEYRVVKDHVRLSVDELLDELTKYKSHKITATNGNLEFIDLDDMSKNRSQLQGFPCVNIDAIRLSFNGYSNYSYIVIHNNHYNISDEDVSIFNNFVNFLSGHVSIGSKYINIIIDIFILAIFAIIILYSKSLLILISSEFGGIWTIILSTLIITTSIFIMRYVARKFFRRIPVYYRPRTTFWDRNRDSIIVGAVVAIITALIAVFIQLSLG